MEWIECPRDALGSWFEPRPTPFPQITALLLYPADGRKLLVMPGAPLTSDILEDSGWDNKNKRLKMPNLKTKRVFDLNSYKVGTVKICQVKI